MTTEIELLRRALNKLPRYSFFLDASGNLRKVEDSSGAYIEWADAHRLFDPEVIDPLKQKDSSV